MVSLHERVVDRDDKHFAGVLQSGVVDVPGHVGAGARRACGSGGSVVSYRHMYMAVYHGFGNIWKRTEGSRDTDDNALALKLLGDVDLVARRGLDKLNVGDGIANLDIGTGRRLEGTGSAKGTRGGCHESAGGEHGGGLCVVRVRGTDLGVDGVFVIGVERRRRSDMSDRVRESQLAGS